MRYHHVGIPTQTVRKGELYNPDLKMFASGYFNNPYKIEWLRFESDNPLPELIKTVPHIAFVVDDLENEITGKEVIVPPTYPADGVTTAFFIENGAPIEFIQFHKPEDEVWPQPKGIIKPEEFEGRYHHFGVPTNTPRDGEYYIEKLKVHVLDYQTNPYGYEWMRYEEGSPISELVRTIPHVAFEVDNLEKALEGREILFPPTSPSEGVLVAFIIFDGAPIEFLEYLK